MSREIIEILRFTVFLLHHPDINHQFFSGGNIKFRIDPFVMGFDGVDGKTEDFGDLLSRIALHIEVEDRPFSRGKGLNIIHKSVEQGGSLYRVL